VPKSERYMHIPVKPRTYRELQELKKKLGASTWEELVRRLLEAYREYRNFRIRQRIAKALCNDYKDSRASLIAWVRLLAQRLSTGEELEQALEYLKKDEKDPELYTVDKERCREVQGAGV